MHSLEGHWLWQGCPVVHLIHYRSPVGPGSQVLDFQCVCVVPSCHELMCTPAMLHPLQVPQHVKQLQLRHARSTSADA